MLKVLRKSSKGREDRTALALLLVLVKTQRRAVDKERCLQALVKLEKPLKDRLEKDQGRGKKKEELQIKVSL